MKGACARCMLKNKSKEKCLKRKCFYSGYRDPNDTEEIQGFFAVQQGMTIEVGNNFDGYKLTVESIDKKTGEFIAKVSCVRDSKGDYFSDYIADGESYKFVLIDCSLFQNNKGALLWEIPAECTEKFKRDGVAGKQFLLFYNWPWGGFQAGLEG